jgi:hypothetical protein
MAKTEFPLHINRRRLLASVAAVGAASVVAGVERVDAAVEGFVQASPINAHSRTNEFLRRNGSAVGGDCTAKRNSPSSRSAFAADSQGTTPN